MCAPPQKVFVYRPGGVFAAKFLSQIDLPVWADGLSACVSNGGDVNDESPRSVIRSHAVVSQLNTREQHDRHPGGNRFASITQAAGIS